MGIASRWNSLLRGIGLNARLAIIVVLALGPFLLFVAWDSANKAEANERAAFERAASSARLAANYVEERVRSLTLVARVAADHAAKGLADAGGIGAYLSELAPVLGEDIGRLQVVDSQGQVIAAARAPRERHNEFQYAGETWFDDAIRTRSVRWSDIVASPVSGKPTLVMAYPILSGAIPSVAGMIVASINLENVAKGIAADLPRNRMISILDGAGGIVSRLKFRDGTEVALPVEATFAKSALFTTPESSEGRAWLEADGTRHATAATRVAGLPWRIAIGIPQKEVTGLVWAEAQRRFAATLLFAVFAGALAFWAARSVVRPLGAIRDGLRRFVAGESGVRVPVVGGGEVARLERDFNTTIAEIERGREALESSEERFKQLAELSNDWFWETDTEHRVSKISEEVEFGTGIQHVGLRRWELPGVDGAEARWDAHRIDLAEHRPFREFEFSRRDPDGELVWCSISGVPRFGADGAFRGYRGAGRYITDRKKSEQAARDAAIQLQLIAENVPAMIAYTDATPRYRYANAAYVEFYGGGARSARRLAEQSGNSSVRMHGATSCRSLSVHFVARPWTLNGADAQRTGCGMTSR